MADSLEVEIHGVEMLNLAAVLCCVGSCVLRQGPALHIVSNRVGTA
jgi:hypothetical protein